MAEDSIKLTDAGESHDRPVKSSPDGSKLLFFRPSSKRETGDSAPQHAFVVGADGTGLTRLSPSGMTTAFVFGTHEAVSWSPDSTKVAIVLANGPFWTDPSRSVYVVRSDGSDLRRIGPRGDIWDATWSPDGRWVAFTMASKASAGRQELFLMHPDGSAMHRLVSASDGLTSTQPFWSRDSDQLLFKQFTDSPHVVDLWSVNVDGSSSIRSRTNPPGTWASHGCHSATERAGRHGPPGRPLVMAVITCLLNHRRVGARCAVHPRQSPWLAFWRIDPGPRRGSRRRRLRPGWKQGRRSGGTRRPSDGDRERRDRI